MQSPDLSVYKRDLLTHSPIPKTCPADRASKQKMRPIWMILLFALPAAMGQTPAATREFIRGAVDNYFRSSRQMREFAVIRQTERREFQNNGSLKSRENWTQRIDFIDGVRVGWTIERDGKPVSADERARG